jgi:hypothetical protein
MCVGVRGRWRWCVRGEEREFRGMERSWVNRNVEKKIGVGKGSGWSGKDWERW